MERINHLGDWGTQFGKLIVAFTSAIVRNEILMVKEGLKKALNDRVGAKVISDIIIR